MPTAAPPVANLFDLSDRTAIVTGASGGIGAGIAQRLADAGANVVCHANGNRDAAEALAAEIGEGGGKAVAVAADLRSQAGIDALIAGTLEAFGGLDIVVNNAGIQPIAGLMDIGEADWSSMMATNTGAPFLLTRAFADHVKTRRSEGGAVVNIASIEGHQPAPGHAHYAASKAALVMFTKAAAQELGGLNIRVNSVSPGLIRRDGIEEGWPEGVERWTSSAPLARLGAAEDIGDAVLFLVSDAARWISGADLVVDGGVSARPTW